MKVKELIEELKKCDEDLPVEFCCEGYLEEIQYVEFRDLDKWTKRSVYLGS